MSASHQQVGCSVKEPESLSACRVKAMALKLPPVWVLILERSAVPSLDIMHWAIRVLRDQRRLLMCIAASPGGGRSTATRAGDQAGGMPRPHGKLQGATAAWKEGQRLFVPCMDDFSFETAVGLAAHTQTYAPVSCHGRVPANTAWACAVQARGCLQAGAGWGAGAVGSPHLQPADAP